VLARCLRDAVTQRGEDNRELGERQRRERRLRRKKGTLNITIIVTIILAASSAASLTCPDCGWVPKILMVMAGVKDTGEG